MGARRHVAAVAVTGSSMSPALEPGDWVVVESLTYRVRSPRPGDVVLAADPRGTGRELIKRVDTVHSGHARLLGDAAAASTDSRVFGDVDALSLRWLARLRYWPPGRIGLVR